MKYNNTFARILHNISFEGSGRTEHEQLLSLTFFMFLRNTKQAWVAEVSFYEKGFYNFHNKLYKTFYEEVCLSYV